LGGGIILLLLARELARRKAFKKYLDDTLLDDVLGGDGERKKRDAIGSLGIGVSNRDKSEPDGARLGGYVMEKAAHYGERLGDAADSAIYRAGVAVRDGFRRALRGIFAKRKEEEIA
jgi:hypothetical protein